MLVDMVTSNFLVCGSLSLRLGRLVGAVGVDGPVLVVKLWLLDVGFCWDASMVAGTRLVVVGAMSFERVGIVVAALVAGVGWGGVVRYLFWVVSESL